MVSEAKVKDGREAVLRVEWTPPPIRWERYRCMECGGVFCASDDYTAEVYCDDCGSHLAVECPHCHEFHDMVYEPGHRLVAW